MRGVNLGSYFAQKDPIYFYLHMAILLRKQSKNYFRSTCERWGEAKIGTCYKSPLNVFVGASSAVGVASWGILVARWMKGENPMENLLLNASAWLMQISANIKCPFGDPFKISNGKIRSTFLPHTECVYRCCQQAVPLNCGCDFGRLGSLVSGTDRSASPD